MMPFLRTLIVLFSCIFVIMSCGSKDKHKRYTLHGETMGTVWNVVIETTQKIDESRIQQIIENRLVEINAVFSTWSSDSEVSQINKSDKNEVSVSSEFGELLAVALEWSENTDGMFDISVKPLIDAYGFSGEEKQSLPSISAIEKILKHVGSDKIKYDASRQMLIKHNQAVQLDFSAIAKGYAVSEVSRILTDLRLASHLVEIGGEVQVGEMKPDGEPWLVAIEVPTSSLSRTGHKPISLINAAMATSGDYRNYREVDGMRISHIVNPKTGKTVQHALASVSVIHPNCVIADILSTAIYVLGEDKGEMLADSLDVPIYMIIRQDGEFMARFNSSMQPYL